MSNRLRRMISSAIPLLASLLLSMSVLATQAAATDAIGEPPRLRDRFADLAVSDELPPGLSPRGFEQSLEERYFGTFVFYRSLPEDQRESVYNSYRRDPHIAAIRTATLELLK